jgi:hypothetical protein
LTEVTSWPGVEAGTGRRGEFGFRVGGREIGHLRELGRVGPHPVNPHSTKMAARRIENEADVQEVIELMRLNYERVLG